MSKRRGKKRRSGEIRGDTVETGLKLPAKTMGARPVPAPDVTGLRQMLR
jgi:hypothetical protein